MRQLLALTLLAAIMIAHPALSSAAPYREPFPIERFTLANGLRVWVQPRSDSESVAAMLVFRAGARYEPRALSGVSHFVEHMLFTGTERWSENEIKTIIRGRGGRWNGWTGYEHTTYFAQVAAADMPLALDWLAEIAFRSTFPADKVDKEREVIFQEKAGRYGWLINTLDSLGFGYELDRDVRRALYPGSTLGQRIIGEDDSLDALDREALLAYYRAYYTPANATLVVVGRATPAEVRRLAEQYFGPVPAGERPAAPAPPPATPAGPHAVMVRGPLATDQTTLMIGARTVGRGHPDRAALDVLGELLSRELQEEIRYRRGLVYGLWAYNTVFDDTGYFVVSTTSDGARRDEILAVVRERLEGVKRGELDPVRVDEAKAALIGRWALAMEDNVSRASYLAEWTSLLADDAPLPDRVAGWEAVTPADLIRVSQAYLVPEASFVGTHRPAVTVTSGAIGAGAVIGVGLLAWVLRRVARRRGEGR
ncbi:MAG: pitrilysin family protein [Chloroflexi bacterium OHK40]